MEHSFASATILLLLITDPLGNIPLFANALMGLILVSISVEMLIRGLKALARSWPG
jgi:small neutral amino acid transporter SnatA (MarC family)